MLYLTSGQATHSLVGRNPDCDLPVTSDGSMPTAFLASAILLGDPTDPCVVVRRWGLGWSFLCEREQDRGEGLLVFLARKCGGWGWAGVLTEPQKYRTTERIR